MGKVKPAGAKGSARLIAPDTTSKGSTNSFNPIFCFRYADGVDGIEDAVCASMVKHLRDLAKMTWGQIMAAPKQGLGHEKIGRGQIKVPIHAYTLDLDFVLAFRLSKEWRLIADRVDDVLRVLYAGPGAYDH